MPRPCKSITLAEPIGRSAIPLVPSGRSQFKRSGRAIVRPFNQTQVRSEALVAIHAIIDGIRCC
jgi:hypothetical protein